MAKKILIVAGEPSGDLHASNLVKDLKGLYPDASFFGLGGDLSRRAGVDVIFDISALSLVGFTEVLRNIFVVKKAFATVMSKVDSERPDLAILVDYPGFNLRLARQLNKRSIPVVYYVSPQVWAWGRDRIDMIKKYVSKIIVFFRFEEELYRSHGVNVEFVGHPLVDAVNVTSPKADTLKRYGLDVSKTTVALLPGSRTIEVKALLGTMCSAGRIIKNKFNNVQFLIAKHPELPHELYDEMIKKSGLDLRIADGDTYNVLAASDIAIIASGTTTLEAAIIGTPFVIVYKTNFITFVLARLIMTVSFLGLVNIICGREVVPELLQYDATPEKISGAVLVLLGDKNRMAAMDDSFRFIKSSLGESGASLRAAKAILPLLQ